MLTQDLLTVDSLGPPRFDSTLGARTTFVDESQGIRAVLEVRDGAPDGHDVHFLKGGPRAKLFFDPRATTAALVTCGGLSPGLNDVIRSATHALRFNYGVPRVLGARDGFRGLSPDLGIEPIELTPSAVQDIHYLGGTFLGSSRGSQDVGRMVDFLTERQIDILLCVGGDGTQRGAHAIAHEVRRRGLAKAIIGVPKTIDNDIPFVETSFGYATALEKASEVIRAAHAEARGAPNGIAVVKVMGRDSGFIAASAAVVSKETNFVLIPEFPFPLEGDKGFLPALERRIRERQHAVIVVAEGAGQDLFDDGERERDASGNVLHKDIGVFLRDRIRTYFRERDLEATVKYLDPSYLIRSIPTNAWDAYLSDRMARQAVHAGMAGKTDVMVGMVNGRMIYVPLGTVTRQARRRVERRSPLWSSVVLGTGQPDW
ncbi:MAG: ATP-dependent 6-phosphofructokinase [Sandaracinaceae bacterium]